MNNIKDTLTTIFGLIGAVSTALLAVPSIPEGIKVAAGIGAAVSVAVIGYFNGKTADGKTKSNTEVDQQKRLNA
ncbi:MAG: hypothetical protein R6W90_07590 [Ignavibacteriaceae bacterium]